VASSQPRRRVATVLFVDIVGSTRLASELGDDGWRQVLARFRRVVRAELKRWRRREQDTAGDGRRTPYLSTAVVGGVSRTSAEQDGT